MASSTDWYTKTTWSELDAEEFWKKLSRKRHPDSRSQIIRIQAEHLEQAGEVNAAFELLERIVSEYPTTFDLAEVHHQRATCLLKLGKPVQALEELRHAINCEVKFSNYLTGAWLTFGVIAVEYSMPEYFDEFLSIAERKLSQAIAEHLVLSFASSRFRYYGVMAVICCRNEEFEKAREYAKLSLAEVEAEDAGYRYHPNVGLVGEKDINLIQIVKKIAKEPFKSRALKLIQKMRGIGLVKS